MSESKMEQLADYEWAVKLNRFTLNAICLWPMEEHGVRNKFVRKLQIMVYFALVTFFCTIPCFCALIKQCNSLMEVTDNLTYSFPLIITLVKFIVLSSKKKVLLSIINMIAEDWAKLKPDFERDVMIRQAKIGRILNIFGYILVCVLISLLLVLPRFGMTIRYIKNGTDARKLFPLPSYYIYDISETPYFEIMYTVQAISLLVASICYTGVDNFFAILILHICGQLENLQSHLANMKGLGTSNRVLATTVEDHIRLIRAIDLIENISTLLFFVLLLNFGLCTCIFGLLLITIPVKKEHVSVFRVIYLTCNFINTCLHTSLYFLAGQMLVSRAEELHEAAYDCEWVNLKSKKAKCLIMIMAMSKRPLYLTVGKLFPVTMLTFCNILKLSLSYISILLTMLK